MNKIIPILSLIGAAIGIAIAAIGLTALCIGVGANATGVIMIAVPVVIVGMVVTGLSAVMTFFFRRDKLCFIAFFINLGGVAISVVSIIIWLATSAA